MAESVMICPHLFFAQANLASGYCGNTLAASSILATNQLDCSFTCPGDLYSYCGAGNRLELYMLGGSPFGSSSSSSSVPTQTGASSTSLQVSTSVSATVTPSATPSGYVYLGCQSEGTGVRALAGAASASDLMTVEMCQANCVGFSYFGLEYGRECEERNIVFAEPH